VQALKRELTGDAGASARRKQAAVERAAREREQRMVAALATMDKLQRKPVPGAKQPKPSRRCGHSGDDGPPDAGGIEAKTAPEPRVSTTDADARAMKMADGGFRPAFKAQLAVDADTQLIAAVALTNSGSDMGQMSPMYQDLQQRYGTEPSHWLADGGFTKLQATDELTERGTQPVLPQPRSRNPGIDPLAPKTTDSPAQAQWRAFIGQLQRLQPAQGASRAAVARPGAQPHAHAKPGHCLRSLIPGPKTTPGGPQVPPQRYNFLNPRPPAASRGSPRQSAVASVRGQAASSQHDGCFVHGLPVPTQANMRETNTEFAI
jgi:hypothetical protein